MKTMLSLLILHALLFCTAAIGQVGIGTTTPATSAVLELQSTNQGFLLPRLTTLQQLQISAPVAGLLIFNTDSLDFWYYTGTYWLCMQNETDTIFPTQYVCGLAVLHQGKSYSTALIGHQCWMTENLNVGNRIDGSIAQSQQNPEVIEKYCFNNIEDSCELLGGLYQWNEMMQYTSLEGGQGICPPGWHIPTDAEWCTLTTYIDPTVNCEANGWSGTNAGILMKSTTGWNSSGNGTNLYGFNASPAGYRDPSPAFMYHPGHIVNYWSSTTTVSDAYYRYLMYNYNNINRWYISKDYGLSVRCINDLTF